MADIRICSNCGAELPAGVAHCTRCLLELALDAARGDDSEPAGTPSRFGDYEILEGIGAGGMGVVYKARQLSLNRLVALKLIKPGMDSARVLARFEAERQTLALMEHPNVAKVFDAGTTDTGRPFFVMELVSGSRITDYCDENKLSSRQRLDLFVQVCRAIQHAHQKGIIHRDIKPSNILVVLQDGVPVPKVIDFGIAKATLGDAPDGTFSTQLHEFVGTPVYMSPEQAGSGGFDIDTRSDIYGLGVLLYELLTGKTPFDSQRLMKAGLEEIRRIIRDEEPPRPSTRLSRLDATEQTDVAGRRRLEPLRLIHMVRGDLDWIAMKCLEKDRSRRYGTANGLIEDIEKHLTHEPVSARPPGRVYRFQKMVRRNQLAFAAATVIAALLIIGTVVTTSLFLNEREARRRAVGAEQTAQAQAARADRNAAEAKDATMEVRNNLAESDFMQATRLIAEHKGSDALAYLQHSLSLNPFNDAAATRTITLLTYHNWMVPALTLRHSNLVSTAEFSPDGKRIVTTSAAENAARVWDAETGKELLTLKHEDTLTSAGFSPDGNRIVTAAWDGTARVWDAQSGRALIEPVKHGRLVFWAEFSPDGKRFVTAEEQSVRVWDTQTGQALTEPLKHSDEPMELVHSASFSPDGKRIIAAGRSTARIWDSETGREVAGPLKHEGWLASARFSPDGKRIITASWDKTARVWDAQSGQPLSESLKHEDSVDSAEFSPDGTRIVTASKDKTARVWDAQSGRLLYAPLRHDHAVTRAHFSTDGRRILTASLDRTARVWDAQSGQPVAEPLKHGDAVNWAQFSPDGTRILTASQDQTARVWDYWGGQALSRLLEHDGEQTETIPEDLERVEDVRSRQVLAGLHFTNVVRRARFSPDGQRIAIVSTNDTVQVCDVRNGKELIHLTHDQVNSARFSPDGQQILTASDDGTCCLWEAQSGRRLLELPKRGDAVNSAHFSPDGKWILTAAGNEAHLWDAHDGHELAEPLKHDFDLASAQFSPDGMRIITVSWDSHLRTGKPIGQARVWDAQSGQPLSEPLDQSSGSAEFTADGGRVVIRSNERIRVWDIAPSSKPVGAWLPKLAETIAGQRIGKGGVLEQTKTPFPEAIVEIQRMLSQETGSGGWIRWGRWLLADPRTRTLSPLTDLNVPRYFERLLIDNTLSSLEEAERIAGGSSEEIKRVEEARRLLTEQIGAQRQALAFTNQQREKAWALQGEGKFAEAVELYRPLAEKGDLYSLNALAWILATAESAALRNGRDAVACAEKAVAATNRKEFAYLDTLAAAYAEAGQFDKAVSTQKEAISLAEEKWKNDCLSRLKLYEERQPYREKKK